MEDLRNAKWRKARASGTNGGNCVEVAGIIGSRRAVRDSKDPDGPAFIFSNTSWTAFIAGLKRGQFDK